MKRIRRKKEKNSACSLQILTYLLSDALQKKFAGPCSGILDINSNAIRERLVNMVGESCYERT